MTMELIQRIELGSAQASITFSSIPQTYTDLLFVFSTREGTTNTGSFIVGSFNGTNTGYSIRELVGAGSGSGASNTYTSGTTAQIMGYSQAGGSTASTFANTQLYIPNYTSSAHKSYSADGVMENNATVSVQQILAGIWANTSPITSAVFTAYFASNWQAGSSATLYGIRRFNTTLSPKATGGAISYDSVNNKWVHAFYTSGTFTPTENLSGVEYLVVAGGGGGGGSAGGGGGAGGYRSSVVGESSGGGSSAEATLSLTASTNYTVTVGAGGTGGGPNTVNAPATNGSNSVFGSITATGGGRGAHDTSGGLLSANSGGSGGGGNDNNQTGASGTANQGYGGGNGRTGSGGGGSNDPYASGGGGGASQAGANAAITGSGKGGDGVSSSITGTAVVRAGGGGGGADNLRRTNSFGAGGNGGGGAGGTGAGNSATMNSGGGGGGGGNSPQSSGGNGGSGLVIVRYSA